MPVPGSEKVLYFRPRALVPVRKPGPPTDQPIPDFDRLRRNGPRLADFRKVNPIVSPFGVALRANLVRERTDPCVAELERVAVVLQADRKFRFMRRVLGLRRVRGRAQNFCVVLHEHAVEEDRHRARFR